MNVRVLYGIRCIMLSQVQNVRTMGPVRVLEIHSKSALSRVKGMPFKWSLNVYRGCQHGCWYCYARETHSYLELGTGEDFDRVIVAKVNVAERLREELASTRREKSEIAIGTATDPYQPIEGSYRLTRNCLKIVADSRWPFSIITKNSMIVRDLDVLKDCAKRCAQATVVISIPILDEGISQIVEPRTAPPRKRLLAVRKLRDAGVSVGVNLAPILPGITDTESQIRAVMRAAADSGAQFVGAVILRMREKVGEHFMEQIRTYRPDLVERYRVLYGATYSPKWYQDRIMRIVESARREVGLDVRAVPRKTGETGVVQLQLPVATSRAAS